MEYERGDWVGEGRNRGVYRVTKKEGERGGSPRGLSWIMAIRSEGKMTGVLVESSKSKKKGGGKILICRVTPQITTMKETNVLAFILWL